MSEFKKSRFKDLDIDFIDGQILSAHDLNELVFKLKEGVERNLHDLSTIIFNNPNAVIVYGEENLSDNYGEDGEYAGVFSNFGQLTLFKKIDGSWVKLRELSLAELADNYKTFTEQLVLEVETLEDDLSVIDGGRFLNNE